MNNIVIMVFLFNESYVIGFDKVVDNNNDKLLL